MDRSHHKRALLIPDRYDIAVVLLATTIVVMLANMAHLLQAYGYGPSAQLVNARAHDVFIDALRKIDSFELTPAIVSFLIWAVVGSITAMVMYSIRQVYVELHTDVDITTEKYVQPRTFNKVHFLERVALDIGLVLTGSALVIGLVIVFFKVVFPTVNAYVRMLVPTQPLLSGFGHALVGLLYAALAVGIILYVLRLLLWRRIWLN
ncbi:MAG: hypothetical protein JWM37_694 [Candidatus Saccharibacteria bacterium]|nr:hypothetical protein [Candidatus Saccharibacteria bacterium]